MVEHGVTGRLFPPGDAPALRAALAEVLGDPERAASMGAAGRERAAERYSAPAVARATVDAYREVLSWKR
jgi:starch synthase